MGVFKNEGKEMQIFDLKVVGRDGFVEFRLIRGGDID